MFQFAGLGHVGIMNEPFQSIEDCGITPHLCPKCKNPVNFMRGQSSCPEGCCSYRKTYYWCEECQKDLSRFDIIPNGGRLTVTKWR